METERGSAGATAKTRAAVAVADASARRAPKVSVVIPNYNYARYLDERLQSILNQTFNDFEVIITDDASTDNSREVISKYDADPRVRALYFEKNSGSVYQRWNDGAALARGEYIIFAGADDSCDRTLLERLVALLDAHPNVGLAYSQVWITDADGRRLYIKQYADHPEHWASDFINSGLDECRRYLYLRNTIPTASSLLMRRRLFEESGRWDVRLQLSADWMLYARMLLRCDLAYVAEPLAEFRTHSGTSRMASTRSLRHVDDDYEVTAFIARAVGLDEERLERVRDKMARLWAGYLLQGRGFNDPRRLRAVYRKARRLDPRLGPRLLRQMIAVAPEARLKRTLVLAAKGLVKYGAVEVLGYDLPGALRRRGLLPTPASSPITSAPPVATLRPFRAGT